MKKQPNIMILIDFMEYFSKSKRAKEIRDIVDSGKHPEYFLKLTKQKPRNKDQYRGQNFMTVYLLYYCLNTDNGKPLIKLFVGIFDTKETTSDFIENTYNSLTNLIDYLDEKDNSILSQLKQVYDYQRDIDYLKDNTRKSTEILRRIIERMELKAKENSTEAITPEQSTKQKPELNEALILFSSPEIFENLHDEIEAQKTITKDEIFESGFVTAFIREYFDEQIYSYYPDKTRLLYMLCENDEEKQKVTKEQINSIKTKISDLGFEELSYGYLLSCDAKSTHHYIEQRERFEFWLKRFAEVFEENIEDFDQITKAFCKYKNITQLTIEAIKNEDDFWETYPDYQKPEIEELVVNIVEEAELIELIECDIEDFQENEYWEFHFEDYRKYISVSKPIELLYNLSELFVQLHRLEMFRDFLHDESSPPQQETLSFEFKNNFDEVEIKDVYDHFKKGLVKKGYLTEDELPKYLKAAFELKTIPKNLFKIKDAPKKSTIESVFYQYYKNVAGKTHGKQKQYAALLGDYFEGYKTSNVSSNFSKSVY